MCVCGCVCVCVRACISGTSKCLMHIFTQKIHVTHMQKSTVKDLHAEMLRHRHICNYPYTDGHAGRGGREEVLRIGKRDGG